ncbi:unnamed protein product, partial [Laminaria digitata]
QRRFIDEIKASIKASRKHVNGSVKRTSEFPYNGGWANPPLPALQKNRGLRKEVGGFYDQFEIEIIQRDTASWYPDSPMFSD